MKLIKNWGAKPKKQIDNSKIKLFGNYQQNQTTQKLFAKPKDLEIKVKMKLIKSQAQNQTENLSAIFRKTKSSRNYA